MKKYPSGISYGLLAVILAVLIIPLLMVPVTMMLLVISMLVLIFVLYIFKTTYYVVEGNVLTVKSGFLINKKIKIPSIQKISETNSILSSPAASFDRLEIAYNTHDSILISPKDKSEFINHILQINPEVEISYKSIKRDRH